MWLATRRDDVVAVLDDPETYTVRSPHSLVADTIGPMGGARPRGIAAGEARPAPMEALHGLVPRWPHLPRSPLTVGAACPIHHGNYDCS
jgi:hypothetical protein